jgi:uncharacterized membrane protein YccC
MLAEARAQVDALTGQLRTAAELAAYSTAEGLIAFEQRESRNPPWLRLTGVLATLRANLSLQSAACRHAIRLAVCIAAGDALGRSLGFHRAYWLPMTIAIVLKPDFTATFSRGLLRLTGTFLGLALSTALFHVLPNVFGIKVAVFAALMFVLRAFGGANYGIFVTAVTALIVVLFDLTGVAPKDVVIARGVNTAAGGVIALLAYALWPTWERTQIPESLARVLDCYRDYFRAIRRSYEQPSVSFARELDQTRVPGRRARSNLEASIDRLLSEPGTSTDQVTLLNGILASSHRLVHSLMALEAGLIGSHPAPPREAFKPFADDVDLTLYYLSAALRGSPNVLESLPDLREDHHALAGSGDNLTERYALVNVETDRITNSLNTLAGQIRDWIAASGKPGDS